MMKDLLRGEHGARRDMVLLNAGAALMAAGAAADIGTGIESAAECIDSGKAMQTLELLIAFSTRCE
jgi:anthranilate phosphoribosyltransferase